MMKKIKKWNPWIQAAIGLIPLIPITFVTSCATNDQVIKDPEASDHPGIIKPEAKPDQADLWLSAGSNNVNGLEVDRYANVVKQLQLSASDQLVQYSNQSLTNRLWDGTNLTNDYRIEIVSGDTSTGQLRLKLIRPQLSDEIINISKFYTQAPVYHQYQSFDLDLDQWFNNLLPINTSPNFATAIAAINSDLWNQIINEGYVNIIDKTSLNHIKTVKLSELRQAGYQFQFKSQINKGEIRLDVQTFMYGYQYHPKTNQWSINQDSLNVIVQTGILTISLPTIQDAKRYLIDQTTYDDAVAKQILPSAIAGQIIAWDQHNLGKYFNDDLIINPLLTPQSAFLKTYFKNQQLGLKFDPYTYQPNDEQGTLKVVVNLMNGDDFEGITKLLNLEMQTNEQLVKVLKQKHDQWTLQGSFKRIVIQNLKQDRALNQKISHYFQTGGNWNEVAINDGIQLVPEQLKYVIFANGQNRYDHWQLLQRQFGSTLTLFAKQWDADFDIDNIRPLEKPNDGQYLFANNLINIENNVVGLDYLNIEWSQVKTSLTSGQNGQLVLKFSNLELQLFPFGAISALTSPLTIDLHLSANDWNTF